MSRAAPDLSKLEELFRTGQVRRAKAIVGRGARHLSTGVNELDAALGGGFARGQIHEIVAPAGAGGTALLLAGLAAATGAGEICALIDPGDAFDPRAPGLDLQRLLWVRPHDPVQSLRAAELALEARFALVAVDLGSVMPPARRPKGVVEVVRFEKKPARAGASPWARLQRKAEKHDAVLLVLDRSAQVGTFAAATVELERSRTLWDGAAGAPGRVLRGVQVVAAVARHKRMPPSGPLPLFFPVRDEA